MTPKRRPGTIPELRQNRPWWRDHGPTAAALLAPVLLAAALAWLAFGSFDQLMLELDPASALGPCHGPDGAKPLCDFANHYYPQGQALKVAPVVVPGFYYSAFFALWMRLWALQSYGVAAALWAIVVVTAALTLILAPLVRELRRALPASAAHGLLFALALPLWHDLAFGQVSSLMTALVLLSFLAYGRDRVRSQPALPAAERRGRVWGPSQGPHLDRVRSQPALPAAERRGRVWGPSQGPHLDRRALAGLLLGLAASIKFYPVLFAVYFALRRDRRALLAFAGTVLCCSAILPIVVLGEAGLVAFYRSLWAGLDSLSNFVAQSSFANFIANALTGLLAEPIDPGSVLYRAATFVGLGVAGFHVFLVWHLVRRRPEASAWPALLLGFATIPFVVRSCWIHYFVFLPLLQGHVGAGGFQAPVSRPMRALLVGSAATSVLLVSVPLLLLIGAPRYYTAALPFWATAVLLPGLYYRIWDVTRPPLVGA